MHLHSGCISEADKTEQGPGPVAKGETRSRTAQGLQEQTQNIITHCMETIHLIVTHSNISPTQVSADRIGFKIDTASSMGHDCSRYTTLTATNIGKAGEENTFL